MKKSLSIALTLVSLVLSFPLFADITNLELASKSGTKLIPIDLIRSEAVETTSIFGPFRKSDIVIKGFSFVDFLEKNVGKRVNSVIITAIDGYSISLNNLEEKNWFLVTHENGVALDLRNHGPLRLVEAEIEDPDPNNLSLYDDWIWMIKTIKVID